MIYEKNTLSMSDGNENVIHIWMPEGAVKACVVLSHGMAEHASRYERFATALCERGIALYAEDHRGHGETAALAEEKKSGKRGYLADKDGFFRVVDDI
ncbi:MAG: alpha/beta hydrolase, partial [Treponema sp.]|nr:alpha/beta hydrolase [Treponema sp.]